MSALPIHDSRSFSTSTPSWSFNCDNNVAGSMPPVAPAEPSVDSDDLNVPPTSPSPTLSHAPAGAEAAAAAPSPAPEPLAPAFRPIAAASICSALLATSSFAATDCSPLPVNSPLNPCNDCASEPFSDPEPFAAPSARSKIRLGSA